MTAWNTRRRSGRGGAGARFARSAAALAALLLAVSPVLADLPDAPTLLTDLGLSSDEIASVESGGIVHHAVTPASDREITTGLAFSVKMPPDKLVEAGTQRDLLDQVDPGMLAYGRFSTPPTLADLSKLVVSAERAKTYLSAGPGEDLNLSADEIAGFHKLGSGASASAVTAQVRAALLARVQAYQARGLAGVAPYARGDAKTRSPAEELTTATKATHALEKYAPAAYRLLLSYPEGKPPGTREIFRWAQFEAHGVPTIALTHSLLVPDGDAWILAKRQFYVSTGYNTEQDVAAFLPSQNGTVVVLGNHTSTDQVTGFGGGAKRSIGSKLLASQLESMYEKARAEVQ